jgi:hypothetical protein
MRIRGGKFSIGIDTPRTRLVSIRHETADTRRTDLGDLGREIHCQRSNDQLAEPSADGVQTGLHKVARASVVPPLGIVLLKQG